MQSGVSVCRATVRTVLVVVRAGVAVHARADLRTDTDAVTDLDVLDVLADLCRVRRRNTYWSPCRQSRGRE